MYIAQQTETSDATVGPVFADVSCEPEVWGIASAIDIYNCNPEKIRSADAIRRFVVELCELIDMKRFVDT